MKLPKSKLVSDLIWNYLSFIILAVSGVLMNLIIAGVYGTAALGYYNIIYAIYILLSQFSVGGVHYSVQRHLAIASNKAEYKKIIGSGIVAALLLSITVTLIAYNTSYFLGLAFRDPDVAIGVRYICISLIFFSLNKVLLGAANGLREMRVFAFGQGMRYLLMLTYIVLACFFVKDKTKLMLVYAFAEVLLTLILLPVLYQSVRNQTQFFSTAWLSKHVTFGLKGFLVGVCIEINSRVDVLMLGLFVSNTEVGIYTFAAMIVEGFTQLAIVMKNNLNPIIAKNIHDKEFLALENLVKSVRKYFVPVIIVACVLAGLLYVPFIRLIYGHSILEQGEVLLIILLAGLVVASLVSPFDNIMTQAGYPGKQTQQTLIVVISNIMLNLLLVPLWGTIGAAFAMTFSTFILSALTINHFSKRNLNFSLILARHFV